MYYASFGLLSIILHVIINFAAMKKSREEKKNERLVRYRLFLYGVMLYYVADILWGFLYDLKIVPLVYADTVLYFLSMGLTVFLWMRFSVAFLKQSDIFGKMLTTAGCVIMGFGIVTIIINFFVPIMFHFEADGEYVPGQARYVALGLQILLFAILSLYTLFTASKVKGKAKTRHLTIGFSGLIMLVFIILQTEFPLLPFYAIGCLIANCIMHTFVELAYEREFGFVRKIAYKDALTNVKSGNAYMEAKAIYDDLIKNRSLKELGIIVFDVNDLKKINDSNGHEAGDRHLQAASKMICDAVKHSPVFRIGGDEFVALLEGEDYRNRETLFALFNEIMDKNLINGGVVIAGGMDVYRPNTDLGFDDIFDRADNKMYERKKELKDRK